MNKRIVICAIFILYGINISAQEQVSLREAVLRSRYINAQIQAELEASQTAKDQYTLREAMSSAPMIDYQTSEVSPDSEMPIPFMSDLQEALAQGRRMQHRIYQEQEPEFIYSFTYPIPPSYPIRYYSPRYLYVPRYSVPIGRQAMPRGYQLPPLSIVQDVEAYNRAKLAEIEAREAREQYEQQKTQQVTGTGETIYEDIPYTIPSQETSREEQSTQPIIPIVVEEKPPTILKMKTKEMETEALGLNTEQFQQLLSVVESQKVQEMALWQNVIRLLFEFLAIIAGTILLGYTIKWAMQKS